MSPRYEDVALGDVLPPASYPVRRSDLIRYAGASGDFNPIHWNERFARAVGLPDVIAHGMFTMATAGRFLGDWAGDAGAVLEYGVRFTSMVVVPDTDEGTTIEVTGTVVGKDDETRTVRLDVAATSSGEKVLGKATGLVRLPE